MKLLIIAPEQIPVPPTKGGSVENCIYQIARRIDARHQVTIVSLYRKHLARTTVLGNVTILRVDGGASKKAYLRNALRRVKGHSFDRIQIDNRPSFVPAVRLAFPKTPIAIFLHSLTFVSKPMTSARQAAADLTGCDLIVGNSKSLKRSLIRLFPAYKRKIHYVHLGVELTRFHPGPKPPQKGFHVLYAGRLIPRKGIPLLMQAIRIARRTRADIRLSVAGGTVHPKYEAYLKQTARKLRIPVAFKGNLGRREMPRYYRSGDCLVCPSQKHEAFGLVNVEAMASGLPVVASHNGGIPEIVQHGRNGMLVRDFRKPEAFANMIKKLAAEPAFTRRLARQGRRDAVHRFSWKRTARKLIAIYEGQSQQPREGK